MCSSGSSGSTFLFTDYNCLSFWCYNNDFVHRKILLRQLPKNEVKCITLIILYVLLVYINGSNEIVTSITTEVESFFASSQIA